MQNQSQVRNDAESPFFSLLSEADQVQVREIPLDNKERILSSLERTLKDFDSDQSNSTMRTFFVHIKLPAPKPAPSAASDSEGYEREHLLNSALLLLGSSEYILARNIFSYLLKDGVRDVQALRGLGICFFRLGEIVSAKKCFGALCDMPESVDAWFWMGQCLLAESNDSGAAECFRKTGPLDQELQFELYKNWGNCLTRLGKNDEAAQRYQKALQLNPGSDVVLVNLGTLSLQQQDFASAEQWFHQAMELNPKSSKAHCGLALIAVNRKVWKQAYELLMSSLDLDCQNIVALHQLVLLSQGPLAETPHANIKARLMQFLIREPRNAEVHYALAVTLFKEGAWKDCETHVDKALGVDSNHDRAQELKAEIAKLKR